jgi:hypothetical protein
MMPGPEAAIRALWFFWVISWFAAALWSTRPTRRPSYRREVMYRLLTVLGAYDEYARRVPMLVPFSGGQSRALRK